MIVTSDFYHCFSFRRDSERMWAVVMLVSGVLLWGRNLSQALPQPSSSPDNAPDVFRTLLHDMWHWRTQESPEFATQVGINDNNAGRLDSFSMERFQMRRDHCKRLLKRAEAVSVNNLSVENQINLDIFKEQIKNYIDNFKYLKYFIPVTALEGPQLHLQHLVSGQMTLESNNDFQKLLARYGQFPRQVDEILEIMKTNIASKIMPHHMSMVKILDQFSFLNASVMNSSFFSPFLHIPMNLPPELRRTLRQQAQERISQDLFPAFAKLETFLRETYLTQTREEPGVNSLPGGDEYYRAALQFYTSTKLSPQAIHAHGVSEIKSLQERLLKISLDCGFSPNTTMQEILDEMRESKQYYFSSKKELIEAFRSTICEKLNNILPPTFKNLPLHNLTIDGNSTEKMKRGRSAWYEGPSLDGSRSGVFHIDTQQLNLISKHEVTPVSLHLSYPGQHLHAVFLQISPSIPAFRKVIDSSHWSLAPAEFSHNPAFVEGWALYSEFIGDEIGLYDTPLKKLVKVARELATASLLAVDTGLHAMGWTLEEARTFLLNNTALPTTMIENNLKMVITWPGQTCSAKIGEIKLKEFRQRAENALGTSFNLEEFHKVLLHCTSSLNVVQKCVTHYISQKIDQHERSFTDKPETKENMDQTNAANEGQNIQSSSAQTNNGCTYNQFNTLSISFLCRLVLIIIFILIYGDVW